MNEVCRVLNEVCRVLNEVCRVLNEVCRVLNEVYRVLNEVCRALNEVCRVWKTLEILRKSRELYSHKEAFQITFSSVSLLAIPAKMSTPTYL